MIDVKNLTKWYGPVLAVDNISFNIDRGMIVGFLGPNGAGKSTTLKILTCFMPASEGKATIGNYDVLTQSLDVRRIIGYMPESTPLYPEMQVREYLDFRARLRGLSHSQRKSAIDRVAERCWLSKPEDMMRRRLGELSRGYKQRVALAEALVHNPQVLILDEPTSGMDPAQIRAMRELIAELATEHTIILSSHILAEVEQTCNHLIIIAGGKIAATGAPADLRHRVTGPSRIIAEIAGASQSEIADAVKQLSGVDQVDSSMADGFARLEIGGRQDADPREEVYKLAKVRGWTIRELRKQIGSLEDFFVQITYEQNVGRAAVLPGKA